MADARPSTIVFCIVLESNLFGLISLLYLSQILGRQFTCTPPVVFFFYWRNISAKRSAIAHFIIKTIIYGVWLFRNKSTFRNVKDNYRAIIRYVSFDISSRIRDFLRLTSSCFLDRWSFPPFVCVSDGLLNVNI